MSKKNHDDAGGEYHWGLAWATVALMAFAVALLFVPHARWFGVAVLAGYFLLVRFALHSSIWTRRPQDTFEKNRTSGEETSRGDHQPK